MVAVPSVAKVFIKMPVILKLPAYYPMDREGYRCVEMAKHTALALGR